MNINTTLAVTIVTFAFVATASAGAPVSVTICGQEVKGTGQLMANLDCSASATEAVKLNGKLLLNGFTLTGNPGRIEGRNGDGRGTFT